MNRRNWLSGAVGGILCVPQLGLGQSPISKTIPGRMALAQVGLERHWFNAVPLASGAARVTNLNLAGPYLFAQTTHGLVVCFDAETGRRLWTANTHTLTLSATNVSANDRMAVAAVGQKIVGLDLATGTQIFETKLEDICSGGTAINNASYDKKTNALERGAVAIAALKNGKVQVFNVSDPGRDTCGDKHDPLKCAKLKPSMGRYIYAWQTGGTITSKPLLNDKLMAFASQDGKFYMASLEHRKIVHRVSAKGPFQGNMGFYNLHQLLVGSDDHKIYSIDLFEPERKETNWIIPTSAPVDHAVIVSGDDAFTVTKDGMTYAIDAKNGVVKWQLHTGKARLLAITPTRLYGITVDGAPAVINRANGEVIVSPEQAVHSFGLDLKNYTTRMTNDRNDRIYMATDEGILLCLRELGKTSPTPLRDPKLPAFGLTPGEIYALENADKQPDGKSATGDTLNAEGADK